MEIVEIFVENWKMEEWIQSKTMYTHGDSVNIWQN